MNEFELNLTDLLIIFIAGSWKLLVTAGLNSSIVTPTLLYSGLANSGVVGITS